MFNQSITDRRNAVWAPNSNIWMRVNHSNLYSDVVKQTQRAKVTTDFFQLGADLYHEGNLTLGVYGGYGHADINNKSKLTRSVAKADVDGYHVGTYASWIDDKSGLYVDAWSQYAWYNNQLKGKLQKHNKSYNSNAWTSSVEVGYGIDVLKTNDLTWIIEPHAQAKYTVYNSDNFTDSNLTHYSGAKAGGLQTRVGARSYLLNKQTFIGVSPFIEVNWLHNAKDQSVKLNQQRLDSDISKDIGELKIGIEGNISKSVSFWSHLGAQQGNHNYKRYEGQVGLAYKW